MLPSIGSTESCKENKNIFSCTVSNEDKIALGYKAKDEVYFVSDVHFTSAVGSGKDVTSLYNKYENRAVCYKAMLESEDVFSADAFKNSLQYRDKYYIDTLYSNALDLNNNVLLQKYPGIEIKDMYIFHSRSPNEFVVYYKTNQGDYIFYRPIISQPDQYLIPAEVGIPSLVESMNALKEYNSQCECELQKKTGGVSFSMEIFEKYKVDLIGDVDSLKS